MERGFFHPLHGYWQTIGVVTDDIIAEYPEGTVEVPLQPAADHEWIDDAWVYVPPEPVLPSDPKWVGVEFEGVMCSATKADQNGLMAVVLSIQLQGAAFPPTRFEFANGSELIITLANYQAFTAVWLPFRQSFFAVE